MKSLPLVVTGLMVDSATVPSVVYECRLFDRKTVERFVGRDEAYESSCTGLRGSCVCHIGLWSQLYSNLLQLILPWGPKIYA